MSSRAKMRVLILSIVGGLFAPEIAIRSYDWYQGHGFFSTHRNELAQEIKPLRPFRGYGAPLYKFEKKQRFISSTHRELFAFDKGDKFRIVCFGASTTMNRTTFKREGFHYPKLLGQILNEHSSALEVEVINVANLAYATSHAIVMLALDVLSWKPDLVVLSHNFGDLIASYFPHFAFDYSNKFRHPMFSVPDYSKRYTATSALLQHFQTYWMIKERFAPSQPERSELQRRSYGMEPPSASAAVFRRNLHSFASLASSNGVTVLFATQPHHSDEKLFTKKWSNQRYNDIVVYPRHEELIAHHQAFNQIIREVATERGLPCADNAARMNDEDELFIDFVHYTPEGVRRVATGIAETIETQGYLR